MEKNMAKKMITLLVIATMAMVTYGAVPTLRRGENGSTHINEALAELYAQTDTPIVTSAPVSEATATGTLTMATIPVTNDTVTIALGATTNVYTFVSTNATVVIDNEVVIGANVTNSQANLIAVVNADSVVSIGAFATNGVSTVTAVTSGTAGNAIITEASLQSTDDFTAGTLSGGVDMTETDADILISTGFLYIKISATAWRKITLEAL